jgi:dihydropyrimidine dehydrogenase (NAD+) subunit PreA
MPRLERAEDTGYRVAVVGGGPAGLGAAAVLAVRGHQVTIFDRGSALGGMCHAIPEFRLDAKALREDVEWLVCQCGIEMVSGSEHRDPLPLLAQGYQAVILATGLGTPMRLDIPGEEAAIAGTDFLSHPAAYPLEGSVTVVGGGATALDCAMVALKRGARKVEMLALETLGEMPLSRGDQQALFEKSIDLNSRVRLDGIAHQENRVLSLTITKVSLEPGAAFSLEAIKEIPGSTVVRYDIDHVIVAIGNRTDLWPGQDPRVFRAGDCVEGPTTVVEAVASGKTAGARVDAFLASREPAALISRRGKAVKSRISVPGYNFLPVSLESTFFGRPIHSPFLLSAAPPTDGLEQMREAYKVGWAGGILKTAFDGVPIHIPAQYMFTFNENTYANCDNVSGHSLERVCRELEVLGREFPDRLTIASTGGPVTGNDRKDKEGWVSNTRKLEQAGAMAIEYSLSCPQGGDGTEGDIVSQNARLTAKIVDWILESGDGEVPKLFKLTGAVTSIEVIVTAIKEVFARYPHQKAGVTLANTFPTLAFRRGQKKTWDEGIVVGMSGEGALHISNLSLAKVAHLGMAVSGNGGPMDYRAAANFLALGAKNVQFCTMVIKHGYRIVEDLHSGFSHLLAERGIPSVESLIGIALPDAITDFMDLPSKKQISTPDHHLCLKCGNCTRCPYMAITTNEHGYPITDPSRCIGCGICSLKCFAHAIVMQERTPEQAAALKED